MSLRESSTHHRYNLHTMLAIIYQGKTARVVNNFLRLSRKVSSISQDGIYPEQKVLLFNELLMLSSCIESVSFLLPSHRFWRVSSRCTSRSQTAPHLFAWGPDISCAQKWMQGWDGHCHWPIRWSNKTFGIPCLILCLFQHESRDSLTEELSTPIDHWRQCG